jgi:hypothetical protein
MNFEKEIPKFLHSTVQNSDLRTKTVVQTLRVGNSNLVLFGNIEMKTYNHINVLSEITYSVVPANFLVIPYQYVMEAKKPILFKTPNLAHFLNRDMQKLIDETLLDSSRFFIGVIEKLLVKIDEDLVDAENSIIIIGNELDIKLDEMRNDEYIPKSILGEVQGIEICARNSDAMTHKIRIEKLTTFKDALKENLNTLRSNFIIIESEQEHLTNVRKTIS